MSIQLGRSWVNSQEDCSVFGRSDLWLFAEKHQKQFWKYNFFWHHMNFGLSGCTSTVDIQNPEAFIFFILPQKFS